MKHVARAPARIDPAGGGTDAPPYCVDHGGAVVNFSVARYAYASFETLPAHSGVIIYSHDQHQGLRAASVRELKRDGRLDFLKAFVQRLLPDGKDFLLVTQSDITERTGLGGSGAMGVALAGALARATELKLTRSETALLANEIERKDLGHSGGSQDSFGAAFGGAKLITYHPGGGCDCEPLNVSDHTLVQIERDTLLICTGDIHLSGTIHTDIARTYAQENSPTVQAMHNLKSAALRMAEALRGDDLAGYLDCLNLARVNHYALHPSCDSATLRRYFEALAPHIRGGKTCGAGGGGFIMVHTRPDHRQQARRIAESMGGQVWQLNLDREGLKTWSEPKATSEEIRSVLAQIG